jgi:hypothetical protein
VGHGRGVHGPRCLPSHLRYLRKAVESRHIPVLTLEPPLVAVRSLGVPAQRTPLTRLVQIIESPNRGRFAESEAVNPVAPVVDLGVVSEVIEL